MQESPAWDLYVKGLMPLGHGHPLWGPEPCPDMGPVRLGDVGHFVDGHFCRLFNTMKPASQQLEVRGLDEYEVFNPPEGTTIRRPDAITQSQLHSKNLQSVSVSIAASAGVSSSTALAGVRFKCTEEAGALLMLKHPAFKTYLSCKKYIHKYIRAHLAGWLAYANDHHGLNLKEEELVFVSGTTKTSVWAEAAFHNNSSEAELVVSGSCFVPSVSGDFSVSIARSNAVVHHREGPLDRIAKWKDDNPPEPQYDQSIFVNYYRTKRRTFRGLSTIKAAAGPHELPEGHRYNDGAFEALLIVCEDDSSETFRETYDPVISLLDYILENSNAEIASATDDDLMRLFTNQAIPHNLDDAIRELTPQIVVDDDGVGTLVMPDSNIVLHVTQGQSIASMISSCAPEDAPWTDAMVTTDEEHRDSFPATLVGKRPSQPPKRANKRSIHALWGLQPGVEGVDEAQPGDIGFMNNGCSLPAGARAADRKKKASFRSRHLAPVGADLKEFILESIMLKSALCAVAASITLHFLDHFGNRKLVLFQLTYDKDWHTFELFPFLLLGVFGGVYGAYFSKLEYRWSRHVRNGTWLKSYPVVEVILVTAVTALLSFLNPYTRMGGTELIYNLFAECRDGGKNAHSVLCVLDPPTQAAPVIGSIFIALLVKGVLAIVTLGTKVTAGIFIPALGVGACAGLILGILIQWLQFLNPRSSVFAVCKGDLNCIIPGLYAMVGAAATLTGATRTVISILVIMFGLTDTLAYAVPVMLSMVVAKNIAEVLKLRGNYNLVIDLSQLPYLDAMHDYVWGVLPINDVTDRDVETIRVDQPNTVESLGKKLQQLVDGGSSDSGFPILQPDEDDNMRLVGYIGANELEHALSIVVDKPAERVQFHATTRGGHIGPMASSVSSLVEKGSNVLVADPYDFSCYMDQAPLTLQDNSSLELVQQFFTKPGARYVVVTDTDGHYQGVIDKKTWLASTS